MTTKQHDGRIGGRTRYAVLAETLIEDIASGRYPVGSLLPPELDICRDFDVSRHTAREAIRRLVDMGLVTRQAGVGTTVIASTVGARYVQSGQDPLSLFQYVREVNLRIARSTDIIAGGELCDLLDCREGQVWLHAEGERFLVGDDRPIALTDIYISRPYRSVLDGLGDPAAPVYSMIEQRFGVKTTKIQQQINAVCLPDEVAGRLGTDPGAAGLRVIRKYFDQHDEIYEVAVSLHPGERFGYSSTMRVEPGASGS